MERGTRWTLAVVGAAVGFGFGLAHLVWRTSSVDGTGVGGRGAATDWRAPGRHGGVGLPMMPRAGGGYPLDDPGAAFPAYGSRPEPGRGWPAAPSAPYPAWRGAPEAAYAPGWSEPGGWGGGYPVYPSAPQPSWAREDPAAWWAPGRGDGPPPPSLEGSPAQATTAPAPERVEVAVPPAPEIPSPLPVVTAPD